MLRTAQLCRDMLLLVALAGAAWPLCAQSSKESGTPAPSPAPAKPSAAGAKPSSSLTNLPHPNLRVDDSDPDRTPGERPRQGMTGELPVDVSHIQVPPDSSRPSGAPTGTDSALSSRPTPAIARGTAIPLRLSSPLSSLTQHNGDVIHATLAAPVTTRDGKTLPAGTPVLGTVVSAAPAGTIQSGGVLSIELTSIADVPVVSNTQIFNGQPGHREVADSAPAKGTEAEVAAGTLLHFEEMI